MSTPSLVLITSGTRYVTPADAPCAYAAFVCSGMNESAPDEPPRCPPRARRVGLGAGIGLLMGGIEGQPFKEQGWERR